MLFANSRASYINRQPSPNFPFWHLTIRMCVMDDWEILRVALKWIGITAVLLGLYALAAWWWEG